MTKRCAEDTWFHDAASKRFRQSVCGVDVQLDRDRDRDRDRDAAAAGAVNPPPLLALFGRCRKRQNHFEDPEEPEPDLHRKTLSGDTRNQTEKVGLSVETPGGLQDRRTSSSSSSSSSLSSFKKRPREDHVVSQTGRGPRPGPDPGPGDERNNNNNNEDWTFNSFQFWKVPLPQLDLSLLDDANNQSEPREKSQVKHSPSDAMET